MKRDIYFLWKMDNLFDESKALEILAERDIIIHISLHNGTDEAIAWGCDLGHEYIRINGEYRLRT